MAAGGRVVRLNGAFGVGKSTVAAHLVDLLDDATLVDPELLGSYLRATVPAADRADDYQDIPAWRTLTRDTVAEVAGSSAGGTTVVPMTLVEPAHFDEVVGGLRREGVTVHHFSLVASPRVVVGRLLGRGGDVAWAVDRVDRCVKELTQPRFAEHVDATEAGPAELAEAIASRLNDSESS